MKRILLAALFFVLMSFCFAAPGKERRSLHIVTSIDSATVLMLSDGSAWEIRTENRTKAAAWSKDGSLRVYKVDDRDFPYRIVIDAGKASSGVVSAKRLTRVK